MSIASSLIKKSKNVVNPVKLDFPKIAGELVLSKKNHSFTIANISSRKMQKIADH